MSIPIDKSRKGEILSRIKEKFGGRIVIRFAGNNAVVEGDALNDYRVHESIIYILTGGKHGKNL